MSQKLIIGLTGSFGSGCTTTAKYLENTLNFQRISLSGVLEDFAEKENAPFETREEKQLFGNKLRSEKGSDVLAVEADKRISKEESVIECFRNDGEVEFFQKRYPNFYLIALHASVGSRWLRLKDDYKGNQRSFEQDDKRDQREHILHGQQIRKCVDHADVIIKNEDHWETPKERREFEKKFSEYVQLLIEPIRPPNPDEFNMHVAHSIKSTSSCLKRHVGAVITTQDRRNIISWGFNEVPIGSDPCYSAYGKCYRDIKTVDSFAEAGISFCPLCGTKLQSDENQRAESKIECPKCHSNLLDVINPTKILDYCRALHAEENAILHTVLRGGESLHSKVLYTTTYPCNLCAKKIVNSGIGEVIYIEPYPMKEAEQILRENEVETREFEGVKAQAYHKVFRGRREYLIKTFVQ